MRIYKFVRINQNKILILLVVNTCGCNYVTRLLLIIAFQISDEELREFSLGVASIADSLGIAISGAVSLPVHNFICSL